jgi:hypothetical protein
LPAYRRADSPDFFKGGLNRLPHKEVNSEKGYHDLLDVRIIGTLVFAGGGPVKSEEELWGELLGREKTARDSYYQDADPTVYTETFAFKATYFDPRSGG